MRSLFRGALTHSEAQSRQVRSLPLVLGLAVVELLVCFCNGMDLCIRKILVSHAQPLGAISIPFYGLQLETEDVRSPQYSGPNRVARNSRDNLR